MTLESAEMAAPLTVDCGQGGLPEGFDAAEAPCGFPSKMRGAPQNTVRLQFKRLLDSFQLPLVPF